MHVVLASPSWPPERFASGIVTYVNNLRQELLTRGHRVTVLVLNTYVDTGSSDVVAPKATWEFQIQTRLMRVLGKPEWALEQWGRMIAASLNALHQHTPVDVLEMEESFGWCGTVAERVNFPVVVKLHGPTFLVNPAAANPDATLAKRISREGQALARINTITAPSQCTLDDSLVQYKVKPRYARQIVNSLADKPNLPLWSLDGCDRNTLLFVGRFDSVKGADIVLQAFQLLLEKNKDLKLIFVGPDVGLVNEQGVLCKWKEFIEDLFDESQRAHISFLGKLSPIEIEVLRLQAAITIVASRWENQPYTVLEAMLQGCPVVVSDSGGTVEIVCNGVTGYWFESVNHQSLANVLSTVLDDMESASEVGRQARQYVIRQHSSASVADATLAAYTQAIAAFRGT